MSTKLFVPVLSFLLCLAGTAHALGEGSGHLGILTTPSGPGEYQFVDRAQIEKNRIDWSALVQTQDHQAYEQATNKAEGSYKALYSQLMRLRQLHIESVVEHRRLLGAGELAQAVAEFKRDYAQFQTQLASLAVLSDVWGALGDQPRATNEVKKTVEYVYSKGSLNLKAFTQVYTNGMAQMLKEANDLTYAYSNNQRAVTTKAGQGLFEPSTVETPEYLAAHLKIARENGEFTREDIEFKLAPMSIEFGRHISQFINSNDLRFYWMNKLQKTTREDWVNSMQTKARVIKYVRAVYCTPMGVPALDIPALRSWNVGYLRRGSPMRVVAKAEFDEASQRATLMRFNETFKSVQSQGGEYRDAGGISGFVHRVNARLTFHNEVAAYLSVMNILFDMYQDELDLQSDPIQNCAKVRERYYPRFGSIRNNVAWNQTMSVYLQGGMGSSDPTTQAFRKAGEVLLTKGRYNIEYRNMLISDPQLSLVNQALSLDPSIM